MYFCTLKSFIKMANSLALKIFKFSYKIFRDLDFNHLTSLYLNALVNIIIVFTLAYFIDKLFKNILLFGINYIAKRTKSTFDDLLVENNTIKYVAHLFTLIFVYTAIPTALRNFTNWENWFAKGVKIYIILLFLWIIRSFFNALKNYLKQLPRFSDKPIDSYIQVIMIVLWIFGVLSIILSLFDVSWTTLFGVFGGISAVILLIFKDTILGFVASIQVSVNDMVRIGDWITFEKFGADGNVIEINLATVKVINFDNTITTIPTYSLISDSFQNWRGMLNSDGRRIKKNLFIKASTVKFLSDDEIENLKKIQLIKPYLDKKQAEVLRFNTINQIDKGLALNGKNLTNLGTFRKYAFEYLKNNAAINEKMPLMVRYLQPTDKGIPFEIYCFAKDKKMENYEFISADLLDHLIPAIHFFDLELFESVSAQKNITPTL